MRTISTNQRTVIFASLKDLAQNPRGKYSNKMLRHVIRFHQTPDDAAATDDLSEDTLDEPDSQEFRGFSRAQIRERINRASQQATLALQALSAMKEHLAKTPQWTEVKAALYENVVQRFDRLEQNVFRRDLERAAGNELEVDNNDQQAVSAVTDDFEPNEIFRSHTA